MNKLFATGTATVLALLSAGAPRAAEPLPAPLEACANLRRDSERLACFDKAIAALRAGSDPGAAVSPENMFGAHTGNSQSPAERNETRREELRQISGIVTSLRRADDGMMILELDNGQVWRQQDADVRLMVATGDQVTIVRASLGTFRIGDKTGRFARFKRIR